MPYKIFVVNKKYVVKKKKGRRWLTVKAHRTRSQANKHMRALYANERKT